MRTVGQEQPSDEAFKSVYTSSGLYDAVLIPHYYEGRDDVELVADWMTSHHSPAQPALRIAEFGCGTGRMTEQLAPWAHDLTVIDSSATMLEALATRIARATTRCADTRQAVPELLTEGHSASYDLVAAFWSLNYPLGEYFETMTPSGVTPASDQEAARVRAGKLIGDLVKLIADDGHLLVFFFDSDTPEQRVVTRAWERIAPFPGGGRSYTRDLLLEELRTLEEAGHGCLRHTRLPGVAVAPDRHAARRWFNHLHFKDMAALVNDTQVNNDVAALIEDSADAAGQVFLPSGVHVIEFHRASAPSHHLPPGK